MGRIFVLLIVSLLIFAYFFFGLGDLISLKAIKAQQNDWLQFVENQHAISIVVFSVVYIISAALSFPGATVLTIAAGAIFGVLQGTLIVSFASTLGATLAFWFSRYLLRSALETRFSRQLESIQKGLAKDGAFYLFTLRLVPIFPFFLVNLVMGLTNIPTRTFFWVSQVGMLAGTIAYVNAGTQLSRLESMNDIISLKLMFSFAVIGLLPLLSKWLVQTLRQSTFQKRYRKPAQYDYNMVVLGAGSGGLISAYIAAAVKAKVALIEKDKMGGDCLNTGCVPSKALIRSAKIYQYMKRSVEFGFEGSIPNVNFAAVMARVAKTVKSVEPHDSVERYESLGVKCFQGDGKIISPYEVEVNGQILTTKNIVIATGARPIIPPIEGLKDVKYLTSDNLWKLSELPKNLVVLGGGPIGCELAQSFARLGSNVTIVELAERLLQKEDKDVSQLISARFREEDIEIKTAHRAVRVDSKRKTLICDHDGHEVAIAFDEILLALGRQANVTGFGLEELGVELSQRQSIATDEFLRTTNYPNIYACGDVCGPYQFTHTASHQAWFVAVNALFSPFKKFPVDYRVIPWATFCDPEVARVGLNEAEALSQGIAYAVTRYELSDLDRAIADGETEGFVKILTPPNSDRILGVTIVGHRAGDTIAEYILAMKQGLGLNKILGTIHIYPTLSEANKMAAGVWKKQTAPQKLLALASRYHSLRRGR